jgi:hypothetical protein
MTGLQSTGMSINIPGAGYSFYSDVNITEYGNVGQYLAGNFSKNVLVATNQYKMFSGSFRIKRTQ